MSRVPLSIAFSAIVCVVVAIWWRFTRDYDFSREPGATAIETARSRATAELARPADLFVIGQSPDPPEPQDPVIPAPAPRTPPKPPQIDVSNPESPAPFDAWTERRDLPAGSFIELASRLEASAYLAWARVTWERVIDLADASREEREIAVRAIARIRATIPLAADTVADAPVVKLAVEVPAEHLESTRLAAHDAALDLELAANRTIRFRSVVKAVRADPAALRVSLHPPSLDGPAPSVSSEAPAEADAIRRAILSSCYKLLASTLAMDESLSPLSPPAPAEPPLDSLCHRITRRAWAIYLGGRD